LQALQQLQQPQQQQQLRLCPLPGSFGAPPFPAPLPAAETASVLSAGL